MNQVLRGWSGYFHYRNSTAALSKVKRHAEERLRIHLRKRYKVRDWKTSVIRFPRRVLYEEYGLYKVPTVAGWKSAHALMCRTSESRVRENRMHGLMREGRCKPVLYSTTYMCAIRTCPLIALNHRHWGQSNVILKITLTPRKIAPKVLFYPYQIDLHPLLAVLFAGTSCAIGRVQNAV